VRITGAPIPERLWRHEHPAAAGEAADQRGEREGSPDRRGRGAADPGTSPARPPSIRSRRRVSRRRSPPTARRWGRTPDRAGVDGRATLTIEKSSRPFSCAEMDDDQRPESRNRSCVLGSRSRSGSCFISSLVVGRLALPEEQPHTTRAATPSLPSRRRTIPILEDRRRGPVEIRRSSSRMQHSGHERLRPPRDRVAMRNVTDTPRARGANFASDFATDSRSRNVPPGAAIVYEGRPSGRRGRASRPAWRPSLERRPRSGTMDGKPGRNRQDGSLGITADVDGSSIGRGRRAGAGCAG